MQHLAAILVSSLLAGCVFGEALCADPDQRGDPACGMGPMFSFHGLRGDPVVLGWPEDPDAPQLIHRLDPDDLAATACGRRAVTGLIATPDAGGGPSARAILVSHRQARIELRAGRGHWPCWRAEDSLAPPD